MTKVPSTNLSNRCGVCGAELRAFTSNSSINRLAMEELMGEPMALPCTCSYYLHWKRKYMFLSQNSSNMMMFWMDMLVLWCSMGSCVNICCTMCMEGSTTTEVKMALISYQVLTSPSLSLAFCMC